MTQPRTRLNATKKKISVPAAVGNSTPTTGARCCSSILPSRTKTSSRCHGRRRSRTGLPSARGRTSYAPRIRGSPAERFRWCRRRTSRISEWRPAARCLSERRRRPSIGGAERIVETAHAFEPGRKSDLRQWHRGFVEQALRDLNPPGRGDFARRCAGVAKKKPQQVPRADPEFSGQLLDRRAVEKSLLDQAHPARHGRRGTGPCGTSGRRLRAAAQTRAKACPLGGRSGREEHDVF